MRKTVRNLLNLLQGYNIYVHRDKLSVEANYMRKTTRVNLKRPRHPMPAYVRKALVAQNLMVAYRRRPPYQRNDYLAWISRAKRPETRQKRLAQMLSELGAGDRYMKMSYRAK